MKKTIVIREGEITGHRHVIESGTAEFCDDKLYVRKKEELKHEEHDTIVIKPLKKTKKKNFYKITQVVEYDPIADEMVRVAD